MKKATNISQDQLCSLGICFGKFTKSGKFRLQVTALDYLAQYAKVSSVRVVGWVVVPLRLIDLIDLIDYGTNLLHAYTPPPLTPIHPAQYKIWLKPSGEMSYLYGNHVIKAHLGRITDDCPEHAGVVIFNMADIPLGFGVAARSTVDCRKLEPTAIVAFHQADAGEYLRDEETMF